MTKMNEIKKMKDADLASMVAEKREVVRSFNFGTAGKDVSATRIARKDVARALTELQARLDDSLVGQARREAPSATTE